MRRSYISPEYQNRAVDFIKDKKRSFLMLEMGLGKTVSTLTAISDLLKTKLVKKVLVIAPLRVANSVWVQESRKWEHTKHLSVARVLGDQNARLKVLHYDYDVYVINRENVQWLVNHYGKKWAFDMVVIDECFPEGTMILTPLGVRDIKHLETGDLVMTSVGEMPITKTFRKQTNELVKLYLSDGSTIECTRDHPFATEKGWVQAWRCRGLHFVRNDFYETKADSSAMQQNLFKETNAFDENPRRKSSYFIKIWNYCKKKICKWGNKNLEQRERMVRRNKEKIKRCTQEKWASTDNKRWKWKNSTLRTINVRNVIRRMENAMCDTYQNAKRVGLSNMLQSRFWHLFKKNSYRGGWKLSQIAKASRRKERYLSSTVRVDYIENIKCESGRTVYNLETDGINDYFAEGILVHNCSSFKNPASQRFKAMKKILPFVEYMVLLTGTPSPNGLLDLWSQCYLVDYGNSLGRTMTAYKQRFFEQDYMGYSFTPRKGAQASIQKLMQPYSLSMQTADYLELPDRIDLIEEIELDSKSLALYKAFERDLFIEFEGHQVEAINAAVLANKLLQYCIAEGTEVLTDGGWKPIEILHENDMLWDGIEWSNYSKLVCNGYKDVIKLDGVKMTPEHKVLTISGWETAGDILNGNASERFNRANVRLPDGFKESRNKQKQKCNMVMQMCMWKRDYSHWKQFAQSTVKTRKSIMRMFTWRNNIGRSQTIRSIPSRYGSHKTLSNLDKYAFSVFEQKRQGFFKLWGKRDTGLQRMGSFFQKFLGRYVGKLSGSFDIRENGQRKRLFERKLSLGNCARAIKQYSCEPLDKYSEWKNDGNSSVSFLQNKNGNIVCKDISVQMGRISMVQSTDKEKKRVYDIVNCGKRNRFTVRGDAGQLLIVHNCNGAIYVDEYKNWGEIHTAKLDALAELIEQNDENILVAYNYRSDLERLQARFPTAVRLDKHDETIQAWNRGEIKLLLAHPQSAGHGINLYDGGCMTVWFSLCWSLEYYQQFNARLHRQGQTKPVRIVHLVVKDGIDGRVMQVINEKDATQNRLLSALR
jgi:SNF2 family DNA or RNA helicase